MFRSLGLASDMVSMQGRAQFEDHPNRVVMRTPDEPTYWHGNLIALKHPPGDVRAQVALFSHDFPDATHSTIVWDVPGLDPGPLRDVLVADGYEIDTFDVLTLRGPTRDTPVPDGIVLRPLIGDSDWTKVTELQSQIAVEEGYDPVVHAPFLKRRNAARRDQIEMGIGQWFGAFDGDLLVTSMGLFRDDHIARYQAVETRKSHRRRGICAALLVHTCHWALDRLPDAQMVIIAEADSNAGRLYRRMGFDLAETLVEATKPGY